MARPITREDIKSFISMVDPTAAPGDFLIRGDMLIQLNRELADTIEPILEFLKDKKKIWCPFDTEDSNFVKLLRERGHEVVATHISQGSCGDFWNIEVECDAIVSNPPYSKKFELFDRLFKLRKPFAMLVNGTALFGSRARSDLFSNNDFEMLNLLPRVEYFKDYNCQVSCGSPPFQSIYVCSKLLPKQIMFKDMNKDGV